MPWATITQTLPLSLHSTHTLWAATFGRRSVEERADHLEQLVLVDRAAAQLEIDPDVRRDRGRGRERVDVFGSRVDDGRQLGHVPEVAQRLDAAGGGAGADRHQPARLAPDLLDPLGVVGRRDRALDQRQIVGPPDLGAGRFHEIGDLDRAREGQQLVLAVEQAELAAIAGGELPDRELRPPRCHLRSPWRSEAGRCDRNETPAHPCRRRSAPAGSDRSSRARISCCAPSTDRPCPRTSRHPAGWRS